MKTKNKTRIYAFALIGLILLVTGGCQKDKDNENTNPGRVPVVQTIAVSDTTDTSVACGGNVTSDGGSTVTARGICWSKGQTPALANSLTTNGTGTGSFISNITGLTANTQYYARAYATNKYGTGYGETKPFKTLQAADPRDKFIGTWTFEEVSTNRNINIVYVAVITGNPEDGGQVLIANFSGIGSMLEAYGTIISDSITVPSQNMAIDYKVEGGGKFINPTTMHWVYSITSNGDLINYLATATKLK
jgi:hypothetical protein